MLIKHDIIDGIDYKNLIINAAQGLEDNKEAINDLNVFPVPDGDTGSNMSLTVGEAARVLEKADVAELTEMAQMTARAMLHGARGNSGVITSLIFRGIARVLQEVSVCDGKTWAMALKSGAELAYSAVDKPANGTILTVIKYCADVASKCVKECNSFEYVLKCTIDAGKEALQETINQNPVLERAGVVDAGAMGLMVIMESMYNGLVSGSIAKYTPKAESKARADFGAYEQEDIKFAYCTEFIIRKHSESTETDTLKVYLGKMGDSIVMIDDGEIVKAHVHTNEPHSVLGKALEYGTYETVKVENMKTQHTSKIEQAQPVENIPLKKYGIISVASGDGLCELFKELGADEIVSGGQTMNPSTDDIYSAVCKLNAECVFILPNNKNIVMSASQVQALTDKKIIVIPTHTIPQGITALLSFDESVDSEENSEAMNESIKGVTTMQITYAAKDSTYDNMQIKQGDFLGVSEKELTTSKNLNELLCRYANKINDLGATTVSIYYGIDVAEQDAQIACDLLKSKLSSNVEINIYYGGQPIYYYIISAE